MRYLFPLCLIAAIAWGIFSWTNGTSIHTPPGVLAAEEPLQEKCLPQSIALVSDYALIAVATYSIRARVLHTKHYHADGSDLVPYDVALGWGRMSDQAVLDKLKISQGNRFFFYRWSQAPPIPEREIECHTANNHLIAANSSVADLISGLYPGEIVTMQGYLVNATKPDGFHWDTSLTRTDTGNGACELFYVVSVKVEIPAKG